MTKKPLLDALLRERLIDAPAYEALLKEAFPRDDRAWLSGRLLAAGAGFILAGLICFFAANWQNLGNVLKLGLPLIGLLGCGLGAFYKRLETAAGQAFAFGTAAFIGVFLAVFGQVYQSGAFVHELFGLWALLLLPLSVIARNKWLSLCNLYVAAAYWTGLNGWAAFGRVHWIFWAVLSGGFLLAWCAAEFLPVCRRCGEGFKRFIWMPLSVFTWLVGMGHILGGWRSGGWLYFFTAALLAALSMLYGRYKKDAVMFGWNALAFAGLMCGLLDGLFRPSRVSFGFLLACCAFYLAASVGTYLFWRANREAN